VRNRAVQLLRPLRCEAQARRITALIALMILIALNAAGCASDSRTAASTVKSISLTDSMQPFVERFNANADLPRVVAVVSPTCGPCIAGTVAVEQGVLRSFPDDDINVLIVWTHVLKSDSADAARTATGIFADPRVSQFHDPEQRVGLALAPGIVDHGPAWDIYLLYPPYARWGDAPPPAADWAHQMGGQGAPADRFIMRQSLATRLRDSAAILLDRPRQAEPISAEQFNQAVRAAESRMAAQADSSGTDDLCALCAPKFTEASCPLTMKTGVSVVRPEAEPDVDARAITLQIGGLKCRGCSMRLAGALAGVKSAAKIEISPASESATVWPDVGDTLIAGELIAAAESAGFSASFPGHAIDR